MGNPVWLAAAGGKTSLPFSHFVPIYLTLPYFLFSQSNLANTPFSFFSHCCLQKLASSSFLPFFGEAFQALLPKR
jgi:hypothetical protein